MTDSTHRRAPRLAAARHGVEMPKLAAGERAALLRRRHGGASGRSTRRPQTKRKTRWFFFGFINPQIFSQPPHFHLQTRRKEENKYTPRQRRARLRRERLRTEVMRVGALERVGSLRRMLGGPLQPVGDGLRRLAAVPGLLALREGGAACDDLWLRARSQSTVSSPGALPPLATFPRRQGAHAGAWTWTSPGGVRPRICACTVHCAAQVQPQLHCNRADAPYTI